MNDFLRFQVCDEEDVFADFHTKEEAFSYIESLGGTAGGPELYVYDAKKDEVIWE